MSNGPFDKLQKAMLDLLGAKPVDRQKYAAVVDQIETMAKKLDLPPPKIMASATDGPLAAVLGHHMIISDGILKTLGIENPAIASNAKMEAVIAHEFSHYKHLKQELWAKLAPGLGIPIIAVAGTYFIEKAVKKSKDKHELLHHMNSQDTEQLTDDLAHDAKTQLEKEGKKVDPDHESRVKRYFHRMLKVAKYYGIYWVAGIVGLAASQYVSRRIEFRADAFSAKTLGNPHHLANALEDLLKVIKHDNESYMYRMMGQKYLEKVGASEKDFMGKILMKEMEFYDWLMTKFPAHPPTQKRIEVLRGMSI